MSQGLRRQRLVKISQFRRTSRASASFGTKIYRTINTSQPRRGLLCVLFPHPCTTSRAILTKLRHVRSSLTEDLAKTVAQSIVGSRLDYCNSPWLGMSESYFDQLQRVQNTLARVVTGHTKFDHITSLLAELHWLPVRSRVTFKVATLVYKV